MPYRACFALRSATLNCNALRVAAGAISLGAALVVCGCSRSNDQPAAANQDTSAVEIRSSDPEPSNETDQPPSQSAGTSTEDSIAARPQPATTGDLESRPQKAITPPTSEELQQTAIVALDKGDTDEAFRLIRLAESAAPDDLQTTFIKARILAERNRFREAVRLLDALAERDPQAQLPVMGQTAEWLVHQGNWQEAESRYRALLEILQDDAPALVHRMLGRLLLREGRRVEAAEHLNQLCRLGDIDQFELLALLSRHYPIEYVGFEEEDDEPIGSLGEARVALANNQIDEALSVIQSDRDDLASDECNALLGRIYAKQDNVDALIRWADSTVAEEDRLADDWIGIAALRVSEKDYQAAQEAMHRSIKINPINADAYQMLSQIRAELGDENGSQLASRRSESLRKTYELGKTLSQTPNDAAALAELIQRLEELHRPFEAIAWTGLQLVYQREGVDAAELQAKLQELNQRRLQLLQTEADVSDEAFLLCLEDSQP